MDEWVDASDLRREFWTRCVGVEAWTLGAGALGLGRAGCCSVRGTGQGQGQGQAKDQSRASRSSWTVQAHGQREGAKHQPGEATSSAGAEQGNASQF